MNPNRPTTWYRHIPSAATPPVRRVGRIQVRGRFLGMTYRFWFLLALFIAVGTHIGFGFAIYVWLIVYVLFFSWVCPNHTNCNCRRKVPRRTARRMRREQERENDGWNYDPHHPYDGL